MITRSRGNQTVCYDVRYNDQFRAWPTKEPGTKSVLDEVEEYKAANICADALAKNLKNKIFCKVDNSKRNATRKTQSRIAKNKMKKSTSKTNRICKDISASIITITVQQIRNAKNNPKQNNISSRTTLLHIPSAIERSKIYNEAAAAIAYKESMSLPSNGSRPWQCQIIITDSYGGTSDVDTTKTSPPCAITCLQALNKKTTPGTNSANKKTSKKKYPPLFRWYRDAIELAVLPHFLQMIDIIDVDSGKVKKIQVVQEDMMGQMEESKATELTERKVSMLSTVAWEKTDYSIPKVQKIWISPDHVILRSRQEVVEHVKLLLERDTLIDRVLHGFDRRGDMLKPIKASRSKALEAGHYRFLRDGLWVIGQENDWIIERMEESHANAIEKKRKNKGKRILKGKLDGQGGEGQHRIEDTEDILAEEKKFRMTLKKHGAHLANGQHWTLTNEQTLLCYNAVMDQYERVINTIKARALYHELEVGFDVFRERGRGRFDMQLPIFDTAEFEFITSLKDAPWMIVVKKILGDDATLVHKGAFISMPGSETQVYHQDGVHLTTKYQQPCHAINVFIPLVDLTGKNGPTEFCLGTHMLGYECYAKDMVETPEVVAGTPVMFDYRLGHRGLGNSTSQCRPIVYLTYTSASKKFIDMINFSKKSYHKLGDLVEKPMSREERASKRRRESE